MDDYALDDPPARPATGSGISNRGVLAVTVAALAVPLAVVLVVLAAIVPGVPWWIGIVLAVAVASALVIVRLRGAYQRVLATIGAVPAKEDDHPRFHNIVQGLSLAGGVGEPDLYVIDDPARNAAAVARGPSRAIVATTGLLAAIDRIALEAVVAECLVRIGNGDAESATVGAALFGPLIDGPARPLGVYGLRRLLSDDRDLAADRAAVALTRYPPGLSSALGAIAAGPVRPTRVPGHHDLLWLVPPPAIDPAGPVPVEVPSLSLRMDVLGEL